LKAKEAYKCSNGHVSTLKFDEAEFKMACPECNVLVYRYRDGTTLPPQAALGQEPEKENESTTKGPRKGALIFAVILVAGFFSMMTFVLLYQPKVKPQVSLAALPALAQSVKQSAPAATQDSKPTEPEHQADPAKKYALSGVRSIEIANLNAAVEGEGKNQTTSIRFKLINHGDPTTPYPDLRLKWAGSTAKDVIISSIQYAHPDGPFTELTVATELHKPPHAKGIDIHLNDNN